MLFQEITTTSKVWPTLEIINTLIGNIIWPLTLVVLIWLFRKHFKALLGKLSSIDASGTGISLKFDQEIDEAIQELLPENEEIKVLSKSGVQLGEKKSTIKIQSPFHQIMDIREKLAFNIVLKAQESNISTEDKTSIELCNELLAKGSISSSDSKYFKVLIDLTNASNDTITQSQVNRVKMLYNNLKI